MEGIVIHMIIGLVLFIPIGFIAGFIQHKNEEERERIKSEEPFRDR